MTVSTTLVIRGGHADTRVELYKDRTIDNIAKFIMEESEQTATPVNYKFIPIWDLLKMKYINTEHFPKALNMQQYYLGYLNFGCPYVEIPRKDIQKFAHHKDHQTTRPLYHCRIAAEGCTEDTDCHYQNVRCKCGGKSCIKHESVRTNTGATRLKPVLNDKNEKWSGSYDCHLPFPGFECKCKNRRPMREIWSEAVNDLNVLYSVNSMLMKTAEKEKKTEL